jgi:lipopolysaccharide/colanic/teichoic acid biosynthesis glycosyltransferase
MAQSIAWFWRALVKTSKSACGAGRIMPPAVLRRVLAGERARADRGREELCVVTFRVNSASRQRELAKVVSEWLGQTDHGINRAGWLSRERLALVLPATSDEAGRAIAETLITAGGDGKRSATWRVDVYPHKQRQRTRGHRASHGERPLRAMSIGDEIGNCSVLTDAPVAVLIDDCVDTPPQTWHTADSRIAPYIQKVTICACPPWKRILDVLGAGAGLLLLAPILLAVAAYIKCVSRGPVFFRQRRYGLAGRPFTLWKFRSLETDEAASTQCSHVIDLMASDLPLEKRDSNLAVIPGGTLLRRLGLDELPQLINVLRGEMSLVGPRPDVVPFQNYAVWQRRRFDVVPGITGLWQVSGKNQTTFCTMMRLDIAYVRQRSLLLDLMILLRTIPTVLSK